MPKIKSKSPKSSSDNDAELNKLLAVFSYIWILCLIPLLWKRDSKFCQFHAKQGLVLFIFSLVFSPVAWFPVFGQIPLFIILMVSIMGTIKTYNKEWWEIPYVYDWSKKIKM